MIIKNTVQSIVRALYRMTILGLDKGPFISRYYMYNYLSGYTKSRSPELKVLSVSRSQLMLEAGEVPIFGYLLL